MFSQNKKQANERRLIEDMAAFSHDPYRFVLYAFFWGEGELADHEPDKWQIEILRAVGDGLLTIDQAIKIAVASGHGIGKSALVAWLILWALSTCPDTLGVVTANTDTQLRTKTWSNLAKWYRLCITRHWFRLTATAIYSADPAREKTWRIDAIPWSEHNPEAFAGLHNEGKRILLIFDEASTIADSIWEVAAGALTDKNTEIIWAAFGNPTRNSGMFREVIVGRHKQRWRRWQIDSRTCRVANAAYAQELIDDYGIDSDMVKIRVRGMFPSTSAKQFYSLDDLDAAFGKIIRPEQYDFAPKILTVDPAFEGDDAMEIGLRQGLLFRILRTIPKNDNDIHIANIIRQIEDEEGVDAVFIDGGYGTGIVSAGRTWGRNWQLVWFGGASNNPAHINKRMEMAAEAKLWLKNGGALPDDTELYEDILSIELIPRTDGKLQLESKKDIKKRIKRSPGKFDAWILSFAYPVVSKKMLTNYNNNMSNVISEYNPFA
jgi:hypothetical protein